MLKVCASMHAQQVRPRSSSDRKDILTVWCKSFPNSTRLAWLAIGWCCSRWWLCWPACGCCRVPSTPWSSGERYLPRSSQGKIEFRGEGGTGGREGGREGVREFCDGR